MLEYVTLRLVRRFLVTERMLKRVGKFVPYYRSSHNETDARPVISVYERALARSARRLPANPVILELGSGATNSVGYALAGHPIAGERGTILLFEPHARLDAAADRRQREGVAPAAAGRVSRIASLDGVASGSVDLVLSHAVLEHVRDPAATFAELDRVLSPSGFMLHAVDYRDHFFKYPFHFLLFSKDAWGRWLDPGDLPRWRLGEHLRLMRARGFRAEVIESESLPEEFCKIEPYIHAQFDRSDPTLGVAQATIFATREPSA